MPKNTNYDLIIFDWDGTIANSAGIIIESIKQVCASKQIPTPTDLTISSIIGLGLSEGFRKIFPYEAPSLTVSNDMCDQNGHMNVAYYLQAFDVNSRDLFEEIGFDKNKIKSVCRVIYSMQKKTQHMASNGASPVGASEALNEEAKYLLLKVLTQEEYKRFKAVQHKIK